MSVQGRIGRSGGTKVKRALGVQAMLEWAFRIEKAQLELPVRRDIDGEGFGFGMEYVLIQRARLGCKVDGGGHKSQSYTHEDAEIVAATLAGMPDSLGGKRMAIYVAELAQAGMTPDWMPGVVPRCVPVETKSNQMARGRPRLWSASSASCIGGAGAASWFLPARSRGGRTRNRSPPPGAAMTIGGRHWTGCGMGCWRVGCCGRWRWLRRCQELRLGSDKCFTAKGS